MCQLQRNSLLQQPHHDRNMGSIYRTKMVNKKTDEEQRKRKHVLDEIEEFKEKKKRMKLDIDSPVKSADYFSNKTEETRQMT